MGCAIALVSLRFSRGRTDSDADTEMTNDQLFVVKPNDSNASVVLAVKQHWSDKVLVYLQHFNVFVRVFSDVCFININCNERDSALFFYQCT